MRRALGIIGRAVAALFLFALLAYGAVWLINLRDEPASADVLALRQVHAARPTVADEDNAYLYLLGIDAGPGKDPLSLGRSRAGALEAGERSAVHGGGLSWTPQPAPVQALSAACREDYVACAHALDAGAVPVAGEWLASEAGLLERYRRLVELPQWHESVPTDVHARLPPYQSAMEGQRLLLMQAWLAARDGDAATVKLLLEQDLRFWRMVLRSSDTLISKMIATTAVQRDFVMGNLVLRELGPRQAQALPAQWQVPLSAEELAMARPLAGELRFTQYTLDHLMAQPQQDAGHAGAGFADRLLDRLGRPLFKRQASLNLLAAHLAGLAAASRAPCGELPAAVAKADAVTPASAWQWLYNPTGRILVGVANGTYGNYILRVADLEGVRRTALEVARLRAGGVPAAAVAGHLAKLSAAPGACSGGALTWDAAAGVVRVDGHDPRPGLRAFVY